jgi:PAS domain S-box-containing protein
MDQMEGLIAKTADAIFVADPDRRILDANPAACAILGCSKDELLAMDPWDFVDKRVARRDSRPNPKHAVLDVWQALLASGKPGEFD